MPDFVFRLFAALVRQCTAAKGRDEPRLRERRFARAAVSDNRDEPVLFEFLDQGADFTLAPEKAVGPAFVHRAQANKGLVRQDDLLVPFPCRRLDQLREFTQIVQRVENP
jgi:hypothetical protein